MKPTFASLFSGFGLADIGAKQAGFDLVWGVEINPAIAEVGKSNLNHDIRVKSVLDMDWRKMYSPDLLWASPPCPNFSQAKTGAKELPEDIALAGAIVNALATLKPRSFILENVEGYRLSESFRLICNKLNILGYWTRWDVLNAADYGVPQSRRRLILRATHGSFTPSLPATQKRLGWYQAIADLIPDLPESSLAQWQIDRLPEWLRDSVLIDSKNASPNFGREPKFGDEPSPTVCSNMDPSHIPKAVLVSRNQSEWGDFVRDETHPSFTLTTNAAGRTKALLIDSAHSIREATVIGLDRPSMTITAEKMRRPSTTPKVLISGTPNSNGEGVSFRLESEPSLTATRSAAKQASRMADGSRIVRLTSRALARLQTMPDWYELPAKNTLACTGVGNGVPCELAMKLSAGLKEAIAP